MRSPQAIEWILLFPNHHNGRLLSGLLLVLIARSAFAAQAPEVYVPYSDADHAPIVVDGDPGDWTNDILEHGITFYPGDGNTGTISVYGTTVLQTMTGQADGAVTLHLAHDGSYLYALAIIQDDSLEQRLTEHNNNEAWKEDALHLYLDTSNALRANIPIPPISNQAGYEQFGVSTDLNCYTENCDFTTNNTGGAAGPNAGPDQVNWLVQVQVSGSGPYTYTFEERIPLNEVAGHNLQTMVPGYSYGFNAEFVDSDAGIYAQGWMFWSGDGIHDVWNYENMWGRMFLEPLPGPPFQSVPSLTHYGIAVVIVAMAMMGCFVLKVYLTRLAA